MDISYIEHVTFFVIFLVKAFIPASTSMMPIPYPRRRLGEGGLLDQRGHVRDWAPSGWYWDVLPSGGRNLVRSQPVVDPNLLWWLSRGPVMVRRLEDPMEVLRHRVSEEGEHVRRYMVALEGRFSNTREVLQRSHWSYDPVMVPSLWVSTVHADTRRSLRF